MTKTADKKIGLYICILLTVLTFAVYLRAIGNDFVNYDDNAYITENAHVRDGLSWGGIKWAFTTFESANWHPLTWISHMLDCQMFGLKPWGHHLTSLILHIANVLLLFAVLKAMTGTVWRSAFVAAVFAVHPLNVESVAWAAERKNILSTLFWFLTIAAYIKYAGLRTIGWYAVTLVLFVLGLMAKPMVVTLPFVLLLLDYWPLERLKDWKIIGTLAIKKLPFIVLSVISGIITIIGQRIGETVVAIDAVPLSGRLGNAVVSYGKYIAKCFWPTKLGVYYPFEKDILIWKVIVCIALLAAISVFVIIFARRSKYLLVGWLWYLGTLVPVIGIIQVGEQAMADRYAYVPLIGLFIMAGWGAWDLSERWLHRRLILGITTGGVIVVLGIATYIQAGYWKDSISLFERALAVATKDSGLIRNNLGTAYNGKGEYEKARTQLERAVKIAPNYADAYYNLGFTYDRLGRYQEAIEAYKSAAKVNPNYVEAYYNLGVTYGKLGRYQDAIEAYRQAIKIRPDYFKAYNNLAVMYGALGRYGEKIEACKQAIRIRPNDANAHFNLGSAYVSMGNKEASMEEYKILKGLNAQMAEKLLANINK